MHAALEACCSLLPVRRRQAMGAFLTAHLPAGLLWLGCLLLPRLPLAFSASGLLGNTNGGEGKAWGGGLAVQAGHGKHGGRQVSTLRAALGASGGHAGGRHQVGSGQQQPATCPP